MSDQVQEILDVPREFLKDGLQFINRSQKRQSTLSPGRPLLAVQLTSPAPQTSRPQGVPQDLPGRRRGLPGHGRRRIRGQAEYAPPTGFSLLVVEQEQTGTDILMTSCSKQI